MKKLLSIVMVALMGMGFAACDNEYYDNAVWHIWKLSITAESDYSAFTEGETLQLHAVILPDFATVTDVIWSSDNEEVATVTADGLVTAVSGGEATITVCSAYNNEIKATLKLRVKYIVDPLGLDTENPIDQSMAESRKK